MNAQAVFRIALLGNAIIFSDYERQCTLAQTQIHTNEHYHICLGQILADPTNLLKPEDSNCEV